MCLILILAFHGSDITRHVIHTCTKETYIFVTDLRMDSTDLDFKCRSICFISRNYLRNWHVYSCYIHVVILSGILPA